MKHQQTSLQLHSCAECSWLPQDLLLILFHTWAPPALPELPRRLPLPIPPHPPHPLPWACPLLGGLLQLSTPLPALGLVPGMLCWAYGLVRDSLSIPGFMYFPLFCLIPDISDLQVCPQLSVFQPLEVGRGIMGFSYCSMECSTCSHASEQILQPWGTHTLQGTEF